MRTSVEEVRKSKSQGNARFRIHGCVCILGTENQGTSSEMCWVVCVLLKPGFVGGLKVKALSPKHITHMWWENGSKSVPLDSKAITSHCFLCVIGKGFSLTLDGASCAGSSISLTLGPFPPIYFSTLGRQNDSSDQLVNSGWKTGHACVVRFLSWEWSVPEANPRAPLCNSLARLSLPHRCLPWSALSWHLNPGFLPRPSSLTLSHISQLSLCQ